MACSGVEGRVVCVETVGSLWVSGKVGAVGLERVSGVVEAGISEDVDAVVFCVSSALGATSAVVDDDDLENQPMMYVSCDEM